jgi:hypothetical protein
MKLPNAENAVVDIAKLRDYSLNPNHPEGKHKARVFQRKVGIRRDHAERLRQVILEAILTKDAIEQKSTVYGRRYIVDVRVSTIEGEGVLLTEGVLQSRALVRTAWMIRNDENFPRLTSCYVLPSTKERLENG